MHQRRQHVTLPSVSRRCAALLPLLACASMAGAQGLAPGTVSTTVNAAALSQLDTDFDTGGGSSDWSAANVGLTVTRQFTSAFSAGFSLSYGAENWHFDAPGAFGGVAPWGDIRRPNIGLRFAYSTAPDLSWFVAPQLGWNYASGASASDGATYGAVFGATKVFSPDLVVGFGLSVFRQIDDTKYFPFVIVHWQITDKLRLSNPLQGGPAGGAGLELSYAWSNDWELGAGGAYRDYRFRLSDTAPTPAGLGRNSGVPLFARLTRRFGPTAQVDLYAGMVVGGRLQVLDASGATVQSSDYGAAPMIALSGSFAF
jgi:hypothetical protein